ncbi:MAG: TolC family protein [Novosphingobium sp.]|nr:TolC family protein [Novosphingobium sp.]
MRFLIASLIPLSCVVASPLAAAQDLETAIADALSYSPVVEAAAAEEKAAAAGVDRARAESNPLLRVEGSVGTGRIDNDGFFGFTADDTTPLALQATGELPLFTGGRVSAAVDQARGGLEIARQQSEQARLQTVVDTVSAYSEVLASRKLVARFGKLADALREVERQAGLRFQTGEIPNTDFAQARARKAEGDAGLAQAEGRRKSAEARYERLTGKPAGELAPLPVPPVTPSTLDEAVDLALQANPALQQAQGVVRVAKAGARAARAEGLPTVGAFAEAARVKDQFFPDYRANSVSVGIRGRWTLWAGGRVQTQTRKADAELTAAEARARGATLAVEGMVIDAWQGLQTAHRLAEATALRSAAANEALRSTRLEAEVGQKPTLAVLDAEREALEAEASRIEAEGMRLVAAYRLNALTGMIAP